MPPDHECIMKTRIEALEKANDNHTGTHKEIFGRLNKVEADNAVKDVQYTSIMTMLESMDKKHDSFADRLRTIEKDNAAQLQTLNELNDRGKKNQQRLDALESKPGKRWEGIVDKAIWAVCAAVIAFLLARMGL